MPNIQRKDPIILLKDTYLSALRNSSRPGMASNFYGFCRHKEDDLLNRSNLSCAYFVSWALRGFGLIGNMHMGVEGLVEEMRRCGWKRVPKSAFEQGNVVVWKVKRTGGGRPHRHIGFCLAKEESVGDGEGVPPKKPVIFHHFSDNDPREFTAAGKKEIEAVFRCGRFPRPEDGDMFGL